MKKILLVIALTVSLWTAKSQNCVFYCPVKEGTKTETQHFNANDKIQSTDKQTILSKQVNGNNVSVTVKSESYDDKNVLQYNKNLTYECKNGVFTFDMQNFLDPKTISAYKDMQVSMTATNLEMPATLSPGLVLADGNVQMSVANQGMTLFNMTVNIHNRKVETSEKITTPAGTFDCYKISYEVETKMMIKMQTKGIDWVAKEVGVVRSETYDSNGKLMGYSVLSSLK
jgi:hypothetical protein